MAQQVSWVKCDGSSWCPFRNVNLANVTGDGVYLIWEPSTNTAVYVGQGNIAERIAAHRQNDGFRSFEGRTWQGLLVTWAYISDLGTRLGVEQYLADQYNPKLGERHPAGQAIEVNLPT